MADAGRSGPLSGPGSITAVRRIQSERQREQRQNQSEDEEEDNAGVNSGGQSGGENTDGAAALEGPSPNTIDVSDDPSIAAEEGLPGDLVPGKKGRFIDERC